MCWSGTNIASLESCIRDLRRTGNETAGQGSSWSSASNSVNDMPKERSIKRGKVVFWSVSRVNSERNGRVVLRQTNSTVYVTLLLNGLLVDR